jgi:homoserine O-acetyltransferase/O-succinyltransferase
MHEPVALMGEPATPAGAKAGWPVEDFELSLPETLGKLTRARAVGREDAPLVIVLGGISANRFVCGQKDGAPGWWGGLVGTGWAIDPDRYRVLAIDFGADESGKTAPATRDQAGILVQALDHLGIGAADAMVGASYGGMVGLSLAQHFPDRLKKLVVISAAGEPHPAATAWRELQRRVVALGIESGTKNEALAIARGMGMLSYRTAPEFEQRFEGGLDSDDPLAPSHPGGYLRARGEAFQRVMTPERFLSLSASIDRHRVEPETITTPTLLIGAESDQLVPPSQLESLRSRLGGPAELHILQSLYGHDMFLKEATRIGDLVRPYLEAR